MSMAAPIQLPNATGMHLDHLNDYCLLEIFSIKSLTAMDLCALAETCKLFKRIAQRVFPKTLTIHKINQNCSNYLIKAKEHELKDASALTVQRICRNFGSSLFALNVRAFNPHEMNLVARHCYVETLKELEIERIEISEVVAAQLEPILRKLQKFEVNRAPISCGANVFANCDSLIELAVNRVPRHNRIMENNFPKMQRFTYMQERRTFNSGFLLNFLERHTSLKYICLWSMGFAFNDDFFAKLGNSCKELEELWIRSACNSNWSTPPDFSNFRNLKCLNLNCFKNCNPRSVRLQNAKSLQTLEIFGPIISEQFFEALPWLKNLRTLTVNIKQMSETFEWTSLPQLRKLRFVGRELVVENVVTIIRQLRNLEELELESKHFELSEVQFHEIIKLTKRRRNVLTLKCRFTFRQLSGTCDENVKVNLIKLVKAKM